MITAVIPAHNEQRSLSAAIQSIRSQSVHVDRVLVVSDNSTDRTVEVARGNGADVFETESNIHRKAGALNQALAKVDTDLVLIMDADTEISVNFVETALKKLEDPKVGAVGAVFVGKEKSLLELCQTNEWYRYRREVSRTGRVWVLSGTAAVIRKRALDEVQRARHLGVLPGTGFYDVDASTEDMELTISLKYLGWELRSPVECMSTTELMPTVAALWKQRLRWYGGALDCIRDHGLNRATVKYVFQQFMLGLSVASLWTLAFLTVVYAVLGVAEVSPFWLAIGSIFWLERVVTVPTIRRKAWAMLMFPELVYAVFLQACWAAALAKHLMHKEVQWTHLQEASG